MVPKRLFSLFLLTALFGLAFGARGWAEDWQALVIGNPGAGAERADGDALAAASALTNMGAGTTTLLRNASGADVDGTVATLYGAQNVVVYVAAPYKDGEITLADAPISVEMLLKYLGVGGAKNVAFLYENCAGSGDERQPFDDLKSPPTMSLLVATSAGPGASCPANGQRLTDALQGSDQSSGQVETLQDLLRDTHMTVDPDFVPLPISTEAATVLSNAAKDVSVVDEDVVSLAPAVKLVKLDKADQEQLTPVSLSPASEPIARDGVVIFDVPPEDQIAATPTIDGKPRPYIILGVIKDEEAESFGPIEKTIDLAKVDFGYDDVKERQAFRSNDPEMFAKLVAGGALDPPQGQITTALQTELKRMGCYRAGVDGVWGPGSRASVQLYFDQIKGQDSASTDPTPSLFRKILLKDDVSCPAPVIASRTDPATPVRPKTETKPTGNTGVKPRTETTPPQQPAANPQPKQQAEPSQAAQTNPPVQINPGTTIGVFR